MGLVKHFMCLKEFGIRLSLGGVAKVVRIELVSRDERRFSFIRQKLRTKESVHSRNAWLVRATISFP